MSNQTPAEAKAHNIDKMGEQLGSLYSALWQEMAVSHLYWKEYLELFGTKPERTALLNRAASTFFRMLQDELWEMSLLSIARLTDAANTFGRDDKSNLTIQALPELTKKDIQLNSQLANLIQQALEKTKFAKDWRHRRIAHRDLKLALEQPTEALADASIAQVSDALAALTAVMNAVAGHYLKSETRFDLTARHRGAYALLDIIDDGLGAQEAREKRIASGSALPEDFAGKTL